MQPNRMLKCIIVMLECGSRVEWRIDVNAFHFADVVGFKRFQRKQIVPVDKHIVEDVAIAPRSGVVALVGLLDQNARFKARALVLADPCQFKSLIIFHRTARPSHRRPTSPSRSCRMQASPILAAPPPSRIDLPTPAERYPDLFPKAPQFQGPPSTHKLPPDGEEVFEGRGEL